MSKNKKEVIVTCAGKAVYPWLTKPDTAYNSDGMYKVNLVVSEEDSASLRKTLDNLMEQSKAQAIKKLEKAGKKAKVKNLSSFPAYEAEMDEEGQETGNYILKFKSKAKYTNKKGEVINLKVKLFDAKGKAIPSDSIHIFSGSTLKVAFVPFMYHMDTTNSYGVSLRIDAVQVIHLVSGTSASGSDFGFGVEEDGFDFVDSPSDVFTSDTEGDDVDF